MSRSSKPSDDREEIADAAMNLIVEELTRLGFTPRRVFVSFVVHERDGEGNDATSGFWAEEDDADPREVFPFLLEQATSIGREYGLTLAVFKAKGPIGHD